MYIDVYPIKRLPRRFQSFTYRLSEDTKGGHEICRGLFVLIPWRSKLIRGIVAQVDVTEPKHEIKDIEEILPESITNEELSVYESVARKTFQSVSSILETSFPQPRKRAARTQELSFEPNPKLSGSIKKHELDYLKSAIEIDSRRIFVENSDVLQTTVLVKILRARLKQPTLFILPHQHDLEIAQDILQAWKSKCEVCTSDLTEAQRFDVSQSWKHGEIEILLTTRLGATFVPPQNLGAIVIARSGIKEHAQYDRNPRYDARSFALKWSKIRGCQVFFTDTHPRCMDLAKLEEIKTLTRTESRAHIVDLNTAVRFSHEPLMSDELKDSISSTLERDKKVLLICNQKGLAGKLTCKACKFVEICKECEKPMSVYESHLYCHSCNRTTQRPAICRKCGSKDLREARRGTGALTKIIKELWPEARISLVEKGTKEVDAESEIIIATSFYHEAFYHPLEDSFGLTGLVSADQLIRQNKQEEAIREVYEYLGIAQRSQAELLIQTWDPKLFESFCKSSHEILSRECESRKNLKQPPFATELHLIPKGLSFRLLDSLITEIKMSFPKTLISKSTGQSKKIVTQDEQLLDFLQSTDDAIVIDNRTYL